ncbi:RNA-guided endonuclease IscB, partial [Thiolapillus sp.]
MQRVFVLDSQKRPLMPCHPARARQLLDRGKAAVFRRVPFTLILKGRTGGDVQPVEARVDPGSKTTGLALVARFPRGDQVVWAANLGHRGQAITAALDKRRAIRRGRRGRKTRYRAPRFLNRTRPAGWLPPSLQSRVDNVQAWARRLQRLCPLTSVAVETVRFDTQLIENPNLQGTDYQRGTLADWELREYLLYRHGHTCAYCGGLANDPVLEREHVVPRSLGGSNRVANQVIACRTCNEAKGNALPEQWLAQLRASHRKIDTTRARNMEKVFAGLRPSLRDAAAVNATRYATGRALQTLGLPTTFWSGGRTKKNRSDQGYAKD